MSEPALIVESLSYSYPGTQAPALDEVSLVIEPGELVLLVGRSGSGKTTLLRAACGLVPHFHGGEFSGRAIVAGMDTRESGPGELARVAGFVAQDPETQVVSTTVRSELMLPLELHGEPPAARARAVEEVALALAIPHLLDRTTDTLSGGELQRVGLAAALVARPALVLLDEPTSQLDPVAGDELISLLRRLNEQWGTAVLLGEHRIERCLSAAERVVALQSGRVAFDGEPDAFLDWAVAADPPLATPGATLFSLAGLDPLPVGVKEARRTLAERGLKQTASPAPRPAAERPGRPAARACALQVGDLWVELDAGDGPAEVLRGLDLEVRAGERIALMGRNGAGKSTLLRACAGLVDSVRGAASAPSGIALLTQNPSDFLVRERVGDELPGEAGLAALREIGLEWAVDRDPRDLSGGERQRLALAIVVAGRGEELPGVICLDEPTRGMDRGRKDELADRLRGFASAGSAVVVATHDVEFAASLCDRVVLLGGGVVIADGSREEILSGGWYFATEVARILGDGGDGAVAPAEGARLLRELREQGAAAR